VTGVRLRPGAQFDEQALFTQLRTRERFDDTDLLATIGALVRVDMRVEESLSCLAELASLEAARATLGVSERSLERLLRARTGRAPLFWKNLARARRSARALAGFAPLSDIAADQGYADQAHMTRDLRRWFGAAPSSIRRDSKRYASLSAIGYG
jgi:AraC-like DNA-binding protein